MEHAVLRLRRGQRIAFAATAITLGLAVLKGVVGKIFHSPVLVADAFHSAADTIAIFASAFGLWLASREKSARFPYGLYKTETLGTLVVGSLIAWAGVSLLIEGYHKLFVQTPVTRFPWIPVAVAVCSIITAFLIARQEKIVGEAIHSQSLIANARESFLDIISSLVVLLGILLAFLQIPFIEGSIIMLIGILILKLGLENIWQSLLILLDANLNPKLQRQVEELTHDIYGVNEVFDVKIREAGPFRMIELKFTTNPSLTIYQAHALADEVESKIKTAVENIESVHVHVEPTSRPVILAIIPVTEINGLESKIFGHFGRAPYYVILKLQGTQIEIVDFYLNEFLDRSRHVGLNVVKVIVNYNLDMLFTNRIGEISFYMLKENFIDIYRIENEQQTVGEVIQMYQHDQLQRITAPTHPADESLVEQVSAGQ
jgi:cation diffusion facilitator family transporter